jgi:hypothetical protein
MNRRKFIKVVGAGAAGVAVTGASIFAVTETDINLANEPWRQAGLSYSDDRLWALSYAILAPNPHNLQPWMAKLVGTNKIELYRDSDKTLPFTDPFDRQITIGLGCFCELFRLAARQKGYEVLFDWHFKPEETVVTPLDQEGFATLTLVKTTNDIQAQDQRWFDQILNRRSTKEGFDTDKYVPDESLKVLTASNRLFHGTNKASLVSNLRSITWQALNAEITTPRTLKESIDYMRISNKSIVAQPDGIDLPGPFMRGMKLLGMLSEEKMVDPNSSASKQSQAIFQKKLESTNAYAWISTETNTRLDQIDAGIHYVRMNLTVTELGLVMHPVSQALQEYAEVEEYKQKAHKMLDHKGRIQMLVRLGYAQAVAPSPRWSLEHKLIT